ncbi:hypothetical protein NDU88_007636 [Pleurodeles waltl]|uniref:Uncharacterized protein n=1 Tax=Pleurodeles waltl TaxID=8319 RepID=A0AAV7NTM3_PLEWA|nr:hypothetical protein NDU88_007636 [Pleurodeles waltl]
MFPTVMAFIGDERVVQAVEFLREADDSICWLGCRGHRLPDEEGIRGVSSSSVGMCSAALPSCSGEGGKCLRLLVYAHRRAARQGLVRVQYGPKDPERNGRYQQWTSISLQQEGLIRPRQRTGPGSQVQLLAINITLGLGRGQGGRAWYSPPPPGD